MAEKTKQRRHYDGKVAAKLCIRNCGRKAWRGKRCRPCRRADSDYMRDWMRWKRGSALPSRAPAWAHGLEAVIRAAVRDELGGKRLAVARG